MKATIYYAHSKKLYGSEREFRDIMHLKHRYPHASVICPNNDLGELGSLKKYLDVVDECAMMVVSEYLEHIGKGVFHEVARALSNQVPVWVLREKEGRQFTMTEVFGIQKVDIRDIAVKYGKLILNK